MRPLHAPWLAFALAALATLLAPLPARAWTAVWRSGPITYTPACDPIIGGCQSNGTGYFVSQQWNPDTNPILPRAYINGVGEIFYVSVYMQGIALLPRYMAVHIIPPAGTEIVVLPEVPLRCYYTPRNGQGQFEFTNQPIVDNTVAGTLTISGCPQPVASGANAPFPLVTLSSGAGTAYKIKRVKACATCSEPPSDNWPMQSGAAYEFLIPVVVTRPMDGFSDANNFIAPIAVLQSDFGISWTYPRIPLYASGSNTPVPQSADLRTAISLAAPPAAGMTRVTGTCSNAGPGTATNVRCTFNQLPVGATTNCGPSAAATLAPNQSIPCSADFPSPSTAITVSLDVSGFANDAVDANDRAQLTIQPPAPPPGTSNLVATLSTGTAAAGTTRVVGRCTNLGPDAATSVGCTFIGLPENTAVNCNRTTPAASLAANAFIECVADFQNQANAVEVSLVATSPTADPSMSDRTQTLVVQPGGLSNLLVDGFE